MKRYIIILVLVSFNFWAFAQEKTVFTLEDCINRALAENIDLKIQQNLEKKAMLNRQKSQWAIAPTIYGWGSSTLNLGRSTDQNNDIISGRTYYASYGISGSVNIFSGLTQMNTIAAYKYNELVYNESTHNAANQLYLQLLQYFTTALYQKAMISVLDEQLENSKKEKKRIEAFIEEGRLEKVALYEIAATVSGNELEKKRMENNYKLALIQIAQLIEWTDPETFEIAGTEFQETIPEETLYSYSTVYSTACANLPEIKQKEYNIKYLRKVLNATKGTQLPTLSLDADYYSAYYSTDTLNNGATTSFNKQYETYRTPTVGLSINIPIFSGFSKRFEIKKSKIDLENGLYELEAEKKEIGKEIVEAIQRLEAYHIEYESAENNLKYVEKSFETYREKFQLGLINSTDFITAQNQLSQAEANVVSAKYNWIVQQKIIELYMGKKIVE